MGKSYKISAIIPAYNAETTLRRMVESLQAQTYPAHEIIVVNDGSVDGTAGVCDALTGVKVIHQANGGVSMARNAGLAAATGDWIYFADADDVTEPNLFETLVDRLETTHLSLAFGQLRREETGELLSNVPVFENDGLYVAKEMFHHLLCHDDPGFRGYLVLSLFKKAIIDRYHLRFVPHMNFQQDELFYLSYLLHVDQIATSAKVLYVYCTCPTSSTARHFRAKVRPLAYMHTQWARRDWARFKLSCRGHEAKLSLCMSACYHKLAAGLRTCFPKSI